MARVSRVSTTAISRNNSLSGINLFREAVPQGAASRFYMPYKPY